MRGRCLSIHLLTATAIATQEPVTDTLQAIPLDPLIVTVVQTPLEVMRMP